MTDAARAVQRTYLLLTLLSTLGQALIWGINTLFLLDAGLSNVEAFGANAVFTAGMLVFEVPTGVVADTSGRRRSYLLGSSTLAFSTFLYFLMWEIQAPFWGWAVASALLGLGFTFFSGATEAWLVDALHASEYDGDLDHVFGRGTAVAGVATLTGSIAGGFIAQATNLGVPYILRAAILLVTLGVAFVTMHDLGFTPTKSAGPITEVKRVLRASIDSGWRRPPIRWVMLSSPFLFGVSFYGFYAMQPYLLELYGDERAFGIAGLAAASIAGAQIAGGLLVPSLRRVFGSRTITLIVLALLGAVALLLLGITGSFPLAVGLLVLWAVSFAAARPIRQAYINGLIPSSERATILSFDSLLGSAGGVAVQPPLGRAADVWSYGTSYLIGSAIQVFAVPFLALAHRQHAASETTPPGPEDRRISPGL